MIVDVLMYMYHYMPLAMLVESTGLAPDDDQSDHVLNMNWMEWVFAITDNSKNDDDLSDSIV